MAIAVSLAMLCAPDLVTPVQAQVSSEMQDLALGTPGAGQFMVGYDSTDATDNAAGTAKRYLFSVSALDEDLAIYAGITPSANTQSLLGAANYAAWRTLLDLEAGTDFYSIAAADAAFATAAQGALAASALQSSDIGVTLQGFDADLSLYGAITPAANTQSLLGAANYAAWRTLLDLEAGTDFYSIAAADAAFATAAQGALWTTSGADLYRASGNVGIGAVPVAKLDVKGDLYLRNGTSAVEQTIYNTYTDASNYEGLEIGFKDSLNVATIKTTANGTGTVRPIVFATGGTERIRINANGKIGVGTTVPTYLYQQDTANGTENWIGIRQAAQALWSMGMKGGYGTFHVRSGNAGSEIDHMSITYNTGNVGIGTTSPGSKLDVAGGVTLRDRSAMTLTAAQSKIWSQSGEMKVIDASGNVTTISPHPQELMDVLGVTGAAKTLGMDYTTPESGFAVAQPKARWLEWYVEIDHATGAWTKRNFNGNEIESGQSNTLVKIK